MKLFRVWFEQNGEYEYLEFRDIADATDFYKVKVNSGVNTVELDTFETLLTFSNN